jgi:hypothetical protein
MPGVCMLQPHLRDARPLDVEALHGGGPHAFDYLREVGHQQFFVVWGRIAGERRNTGHAVGENAFAGRSSRIQRSQHTHLQVGDRKVNWPAHPESILMSLGVKLCLRLAASREDRRGSPLDLNNEHPSTATALDEKEVRHANVGWMVMLPLERSV